MYNSGLRTAGLTILLFCATAIADPPALSSPECETHLLAKGLAGVRVTRVIPSDGSASYIEKSYRSHAKFGIELPGYQLLREVAQGAKPGTIFRTLTVRVSSKPQTLVLEDTQGRGLVEVLEDPATPNRTKRALREAYLDQLRTLVLRIENRRTVVDKDDTRVFDGMPMVTLSVAAEPNPISLSLRADQIVVTFDPNDRRKFTLTIIDPY